MSFQADSCRWAANWCRLLEEDFSSSLCEPLHRAAEVSTQYYFPQSRQFKRAQGRSRNAFDDPASDITGSPFPNILLVAQSALFTERRNSTWIPGGRLLQAILEADYYIQYWTITVITQVEHLKSSPMSKNKNVSFSGSEFKWTEHFRE